MAVARNHGVRIHWRDDGIGPPLLLLNSVGCGLGLWDAAMPYLGGFRVLRMNMRGHGGSDSPDGDYSLDQLASDALCVLDAAEVERAAICGLSLGGMVPMCLALQAPEQSDQRADSNGEVVNRDSRSRTDRKTRRPSQR